MPRKFLRRLIPNSTQVRQYKVLHIFGERLFHPALWDLNRRSAAGGIAEGLFCGLIPGPLQMLGAGIVALFVRVNLPLALATTLYTNPITIVPLYLLAYKMGRFLLGNGAGIQPTPPPDWSFANPGASVDALGQWMFSLGAPLAVGLVALASTLALAGYVLVRVGWNLYLRYAWVARRRKRMANVFAPTQDTDRRP